MAIPYAPSTPYRQNNTISDLILRSGQAQADAELQKGAIWGRTLGNVGDIAAGAVQDYQIGKAEKAKQDAISRRDAAMFQDIQDAESRGEAPDPALFLKRYGPDGVTLFQGYQKMREASLRPGMDAQTALPDILASYSKLSPGGKKLLYEGRLKDLAEKSGWVKQALPSEWTPELDAQILSLKDAFGAASQPVKTREVRVRNADGTESVQIVEDKPATFTSAAEPPKPGTFEAFVVGKYGAKPTPEQLIEGRKAWEAAGNKPAGSGNKIWVMRPGADGKLEPILIAESEYKPGDQPANSRSGEGRPSNGAEKRSLAFFNRAKQADDELKNISPTIAQMGLAGQTRMALAPNFLQSEEGRAYTQAQRAFTEARLRKDSGAAIPNEEYENDRKTYFVQPGDDDETIAQKERGRAAVLSSLAFESGRALNEFYGDEADGMLEAFKGRQATSAPPASPGNSNPLAVTAPDGKTYTFPNKAQADAFRKRAGIK